MSENEEGRKTYNEKRPHPCDWPGNSNITKDQDKASSLAGYVKEFLSELEISQLRGPILSLYAGEAGAEKEFVSLLPISDKRITAIDYNPNLAAENKDEQTIRITGDVLDKLPELKSESFGIVTIFGSDGSMFLKDWGEINKELYRVLRSGGYICIYPNIIFETAPNGFKVVFPDEGFDYWVFTLLKKV